jgi:hypothetical protein
MRRLSRRSVLRGAGSIGLGLPMLQAMGAGMLGCGRRSGGGLSPRAEHLTGSPQRLIIFVTPHGTLPDIWFPTTSRDGSGPVTETDFDLKPLIAPHAAYADKLTIFSGVTNRAVPAGHYEGSASLLTGMAPVGASEPELLGATRSVDHVLGDRIGMLPDSPPHANVVLGPDDWTAGTHCVSYAGHQSPAPKTVRGLDLLTQLAGGDIDTTSRLYARRQSILDEVRQDYQALLTRVGAGDRARLEQHVESIREVEARMTRRVRACDPSSVAPGESSDVMRELPQVMRDMIDVLVLGMSCDSTRVASYLIRQEGHSAAETAGWLGIGPPDNPFDYDSRDNAESGNVAHLGHYWEDPGAHAKLATYHTWVSEQVAYLVQRLAETPDGDGTLLDSTVVLQISGLDHGYHSVQNLPALMIGDAQGRLRTGRYVQLEGRTHNDLLMTLFPILGLDAPESFGDPALCSGVLDMLFA